MGQSFCEAPQSLLQSKNDEARVPRLTQPSTAQCAQMRTGKRRVVSMLQPLILLGYSSKHAEQDSCAASP